VIDADAMQRAGYPRSVKETKTCGVPKKRGTTLLIKVKKDITGVNPLFQKQLAMKYGLSKSTINHVMREYCAESIVFMDYPMLKTVND
jgi:hypothetical protein